MRIGALKEQTDIREIWESFDRKHNPQGTAKGRALANREFGKKFMELYEAKKIQDRDISFPELYEKLVLDVEENLDSSAFPIITSQLISSKIISAYEAFPRIGMGLVTVVQSKLKEGKVVGWQAIGTMKKLLEREEYKEVIPPDQKAVAVMHDKIGGLLSLSREDLTFDQTGELMRRASAIGDEAARDQDERVLRIITDADSKGYNKTTLYSVGNSNLLSGAGSALGTDGFESCHKSLMGKTDERSKPIWVFGNQKPVMMVGATLEPMAFKLKNNEYGPQGTANLDKNFAFNRFDYVVNPYLDAISTTAWFYGGFRQQFFYEEVWPLQTFSRTGQDSEDGFKKDLLMQWKAGYYGGAGAVDFRYVYKNAGA